MSKINKTLPDKSFAEKGKIIQEQKEKIVSLKKQQKDIRSTKFYKLYQYFPKKKG